MIYNDESASLFRNTQTKSKPLTLRNDISAYFFFGEEKKMHCKQSWVKISEW